MCEIFPEVESCCYVASVRVGMLLIAVLSITTGSATLGVIERTTGVCLGRMMGYYKNATKIKNPKDAISELRNFIASAVSAMSVIFMIAGIALLFADLSDQEGFAQIFVWLIFINIMIGFISVFAIGFECIMKSKCLLVSLDWLTASFVLVGLCFYLIMWYYFACVANSYVLNGYP